MPSVPNTKPDAAPTSASQTKRDESPVAVRIEGLSKSFGAHEVLRNVSLEVAPGEIFVLMGPSGSGKSVLLKHIVGLEAPSAGRVTVDGLDAADPATRHAVHMALVFQAGALFNSLSVYDNLALYLREHRLGTETQIREKVRHALKILSLENAERKSPAELSGGMRKRVAIARALVMEPQLMLYDEPTSELDPIMSATISEIIATLKTQTRVTTIVVSHDRDLALGIADRVGILMQGELLTIATPAELRRSTDPRISDFLNPQINLSSPRFKQLETAKTS
ncbi:ABC transporter ATP-binding protein [Cephaloticoccus capnophilus]|uniref:ABC transporter ATP-binding protein n=1 Tax=Cephaloticoccus capnophilus TaxID=1548208 RepID=UPI0009EDB779|nr:ATP-binding cassette domain-containing protein [Cephaloticoccus capnophilus]